MSYGLSSCELHGADRISQGISLHLVGLSGTTFKVDPLPAGWNAGRSLPSANTFVNFFRSVGTGVTFPSSAKPFPLVLSFDVTPVGGVAQKQTVTIDPPASINDACLGSSFTSLDPLTFAGLFADDEASPLASDIDFVASKGIALGCDQLLRRFCPTGSVTRGEMAVFLTRALTLPGANNTFVDDNGSPYEAAIASIASGGITAGCSSDGTRFCPNELVTRAQMRASWSVGSSCRKARRTRSWMTMVRFTRQTSRVSLLRVSLLDVTRSGRAIAPPISCRANRWPLSFVVR